MTLYLFETRHNITLYTSVKFYNIRQDIGHNCVEKINRIKLIIIHQSINQSINQSIADVEWLQASMVVFHWTVRYQLMQFLDRCADEPSQTEPCSKQVAFVLSHLVMPK